MPDYLIRSAAWNAIVTAADPVEAVDLSVTPDAPDLSREALGEVFQVIDLDACVETATYLPTAPTLARLGFAEVETPCGLIVPSTAVS